MNPILIYILIVNFQLGLKAFGDWWYKKYKKKIINHGLSSAIDVLIYCGSSLWLFGNNIVFAVGMIVLAIGYRWNMYDQVYNYINNHKWNHYGTSDWVDRFQIKMGKYHLTTKFGVIILGIILIAI